MIASNVEVLRDLLLSCQSEKSIQVLLLFEDGLFAGFYFNQEPAEKTDLIHLA